MDMNRPHFLDLKDKMNRSYCYGCNSGGSRPSVRSSEGEDSVSMQANQEVKTEDECDTYLCAACVEKNWGNESLSPQTQISTEDTNVNASRRVKNEKLDVVFETIKADPEELIIPGKVPSPQTIHEPEPDVNECILPNEIELNSEITVKNFVSNKNDEMKEKFPIVKIHRMDLELEEPQTETSSNKCLKCDRNFSAEEYLNNHHQAVHSEILLKYECFFCPEKFSLEWFLKNHLETIHSGIVIRFTCPVCRKTFYSKNNLEEHKRTDHNIRGQPFNCNHCDESFASITQLRKHLVQFHSNTVEAAAADSNMKLKEKTVAETKENLLMCRACKKMFVTVQMKKNHLDLEHGGKYACFCGKSFISNRRLTHHELTHEKTTKLFQCEICSNTFPCSRSLDLHYKIHYSHFKDVKRVCSKCKRIFLDEANLKHHIRQAHPNSTINPTCATCGSTYKNSLLLRDHERKMHSTREPHSCQICNKTFARKHSLTLHKRLHKKPVIIDSKKNRIIPKSEEVPDVKEIDVMTCFSQTSSKFSCPVCIYSTERKNHFRRHLKGIHSILSSRKKDNSSDLQIEPLHKCLKCDKMFSRKDLLYTHDRLRHVQVPQPSTSNPSRPLMFECGICKKYIPLGQLILHINRHKSSVLYSVRNKEQKIDMNNLFCEETRIFKCCLCSEKTPSRIIFIKHVQVAHKAKIIKDHDMNVREGFPFQCSKCDMRLASKFHWREHELRHGKVRKSRKKT